MTDADYRSALNVTKTCKLTGLFFIEAQTVLPSSAKTPYSGMLKTK